ncbi:hypothetical protein [Halonotius roseus]|jgi:hypothetical protein|uniref:DUF4145 domain-containing protein n=1 Tax=Halonotius roseus TaxID=2511997 RepID=A0A544QPC7_9EURY|nr:hypothetical protein [Halonotius roseus]TQQ80744.1 hypothetical protein EWF95_09710 [Halonotius roseus]
MTNESDDDDDTYTKVGYNRRAAWFDRTRDERTGEGNALTPGGSDSTHLEIEVKSNYINANFLSTIITASSVIEGMLFRQVIQCDPDRRQEQHTLHGVFNLATKYDVISEDVTDAFNSLNEIRDLRNGVVHYREGHEDDALVAQHHMENMMETHPNKYGKEHAEKMLKAMFDIKAKCAENRRKFWDHEGPLRQGINTIKTGKEAYCDTCGAALKDTKLNYEAEWNGGQVVSEYAECHECGENVISVFTDS